MQPEEPRIFQPGDPFRQYPYTIERFLGAGAGGQVYAARQNFTGELRALKVGHLAESKHAKTVARNLIAARATYSIQHTNVVRVFELACESDGMVWQLMECLEGCTVAELLRRYGKLSPLYAISVALEVAWGLQAAHEQQVIHRDVQPSNVFVTVTGRVKLLDFSLAKVIPARLQTTLGNRGMGTAGYMSPEHIKQAPPTPQFDVYSLGIMFWQMLTGRHPWAACAGDLVTLVKKQLGEDPESLVPAAGLPAYCDEVIRRATAKDPRDRYEGIWPFARALGDLSERLAADPEAAALVRRPPAWERLHPIARDPEGYHQYRGPSSLPRKSPPPDVPSARIVVAPALAKTMLLPVAQEAQATPERAAVHGREASPPTPPDVCRLATLPRDVAPPTTRSRARSRSRALWVALAASPVLLALGAGLWLLAFKEAPRAAPPSSSAVAPRAPAPSAAADPRRPPHTKR